MSRGCSACAIALLGGAIILLLGGSASAGLTIVSQKVKVDYGDREVFFTLVFNHAPDFVTTDMYGRPADSFQYEIVPNTNSSIENYPLQAVRTVIRGDEIGPGSLLPIRDGFENGSDPSPTSGGWGFVRAEKSPFKRFSRERSPFPPHSTCWIPPTGTLLIGSSPRTMDRP